MKFHGLKLIRVACHVPILAVKALVLFLFLHAAGAITVRYLGQIFRPYITYMYVYR